jgi:hypothetical protein
MKRLTALAAGAVVALSLTGCMRVQADFVLSEDDMVMAIEDATIEQLGLSADDFLGQMDTELGDDLFMPGMDREEYKEDGHTGYRYTSEDAPLAVVSDEVMSFTRDGDEYVVTGQLENSDMGFTESDIADFEAFGMSEPDITFSVTFPGEVTDANGVIDGNTVTWTYVLGETLDFDARGSAGGSGSGGSSGDATDAATDDATDEATDGATDSTDEATDAAGDEPTEAASSSDDGGVSWLLWAGIGLGALALVGLAAWLIARNRKGGGPGGPGAYAAAGAPAWGQQQGQQQWGQQPGQNQQWGQPDQTQQWPQQPGQQGQPGQQWGQQGQPGQQQWGQQPGQPGQQWGQQPGQAQQPGQQGQQQWGQPDQTQQWPQQPGQQGQPGQQWGQPGAPGEEPPAPEQQPWR